MEDWNKKSCNYSSVDDISNTFEINNIKGTIALLTHTEDYSLAFELIYHDRNWKNQTAVIMVREQKLLMKLQN